MGNLLSLSTGKLNYSYNHCLTVCVLIDVIIGSLFEEKEIEFKFIFNLIINNLSTLR